MNIINCREIADYYKKKYKSLLTRNMLLCEEKIPKDLFIIQFGENKASNIYVNGKIKDCKECGINVNVIKFGEDIEKEKVDKIMKNIISDDNVCGVMIQLPIMGVNSKYQNDFINNIPEHLDVDGMKSSIYKPCTPVGIMLLLEYIDKDVDGLNCVVIGRSEIVGKPLADVLLKRNATVTICHSHTKNIEEITKNADIIFSAVGKRNFITSKMVKNGSLIVDIGINFDENGKICGDVNKEDLLNRDVTITPVPNGVGLMTRVGLIHNICKNIK